MSRAVFQLPLSAVTSSTAKPWLEVGHHLRKLFRLERRMQRRCGSAELEDSKQSNRKAPAVRDQRGDPIARARPLPGEKTGEPRGLLVEFGPGKRSTVPDEGRFGAPAPCVILQETDKIFFALFSQKLLRHGILYSFASSDFRVAKLHRTRILTTKRAKDTKAGKSLINFNSFSYLRELRGLRGELFFSQLCGLCIFALFAVNFRFQIG